MERAIFALLLVATAFSATAETVKRRLPACVSEELLDELTGYAAKNDDSGFIELLRSGKCTILKPGEYVSVISTGFVTATIRYNGVKLYTPSESVR